MMKKVIVLTLMIGSVLMQDAGNVDAAMKKKAAKTAPTEVKSIELKDFQGKNSSLVKIENCQLMMKLDNGKWIDMMAPLSEFSSNIISNDSFPETDKWGDDSRGKYFIKLTCETQKCNDRHGQSTFMSFEKQNQHYAIKAKSILTEHIKICASKRKATEQQEQAEAARREREDAPRQMHNAMCESNYQNCLATCETISINNTQHFLCKDRCEKGKNSCFRY